MKEHKEWVADDVLFTRFDLEVFKKMMLWFKSI